ncbi:MAG: hypothetical protein C0424_06955 [Sphingobacteriaceae bacterium]|nr:hypothetical protein [Sphingobacteriaceae bacterium]
MKIMSKYILYSILSLVPTVALAQVVAVESVELPAEKVLIYQQEQFFSNMRQLTFGGDNAEAYWSFDSKQLVFQSNFSKWGVKCDQIFLLEQTEELIPNPPMISTGKGRTTCAYFMPGDSVMLYASTHIGNANCPPPPAPRPDRKYLWQIDPNYDIFFADKQGNIMHQLTSTPGYDAEATVSPDGKYIVFTSTRNGDLDLYLYDIAKKTTKQVTKTLGYDGGAFFSPDSKKLLFRASRPKTPEAIKEYKELLAQGLVAPTDMEIFTCNLDGSDMRQITKLGKANWAPYFHPDGKRILFSSNHHTQRGFPFNIFMIDLDGKNLTQITFDNSFDAFPMFSPDGKKLVFASNRNNGGGRDTNLFVTDWVEPGQQKEEK